MINLTGEFSTVLSQGKLKDALRSARLLLLKGDDGDTGDSRIYGRFQEVQNNIPRIGQSVLGKVPLYSHLRLAERLDQQSAEHLVDLAFQPQHGPQRELRNYGAEPPVIYRREGRELLRATADVEARLDLAYEAHACVERRLRRRSARYQDKDPLAQRLRLDVNSERVVSHIKAGPELCLR